MGLTLTKAGDLLSRAARAKVGSTGIRTFVRSKMGATTTSSGGVVGAVEWVINAALSFGGWICKKFWDAISSFASWSMAKLWTMFCASVQYIWHFDWNASDEEMDNALKAAWDAFGGQLGGLAGKAAGSLFVLGGGAVLFGFNEALGLHVLREVGSEAFDDMVASAAPVMESAKNLGMRAAFNSTYKAIRDSMGMNPDSFYETDEELVEKQLRGEITFEQRMKARKGRDALKAERKPYTFAENFEKWIETFPEGFIRNWVENFFEEGIETIQELGYVAFSAVDSHIAAHKMGTKVATGANVSGVTQVQFNRNVGTLGTPVGQPSTP